MSYKPPEAEHTLVNFLKTHQPTAPPAEQSLEHRLLTQIQQTPQASSVKLLSHVSQKSQTWLTSILLAIGLLLGAGVTWRWQQQNALEPSVPKTSSTELEAFLQESWLMTVGSSEPSLNGEFDNQTKSLESATPAATTMPDVSPPVQEWLLLLDTIESEDAP